ncbi:hypothetical protein GCM10023065_08410 [Microbacterium laevaniformans]|nr:hypothetical protein GCM10017578_07410 [Microbacterium laevaniformans]
MQFGACECPRIPVDAQLDAVAVIHQVGIKGGHAADIRELSRHESFLKERVQRESGAEASPDIGADGGARRSSDALRGNQIEVNEVGTPYCASPPQPVYGLE